MIVQYILQIESTQFAIEVFFAICLYQGSGNRNTPKMSVAISP